MSVFTVEPGENSGEELYYQISTMDNFNDTYLGIMVGNMHSMTADNTNSKDLIEYEIKIKHSITDKKVYLEDLSLKTITDISVPETGYKFYEPNSGEINKRFRLFMTEKDDTEINLPEENGVNIYTYNKNIWIDNPGDVGNISLYDVSGKLIMTRTIQANAKTGIDSDLQPGIYLIQFVAKDKNISQRIILK